MNPFDNVNQAMKDRDDKFTKREFASMHILAGIVSDAEYLNQQSKLELAQEAIKLADILLQELGKPRGK